MQIFPGQFDELDELPELASRTDEFICHSAAQMWVNPGFKNTIKFRICDTTAYKLLGAWYNSLNANVPECVRLEILQC